MRKPALLPLLFLSFVVSLSFLTPLYVDAKPNGDNTFGIDRVDRAIEIRYGGLVVINDTIRISANQSQSLTLKNFPIGFPYIYGPYLCNCLTYNPSNPDQQFNVVLDAGLQGEIGYYGLSIVFPEEGVQIKENEPLTLTVITVFSDLLSSAIRGNETLYTVNFPAYPSLTRDVSVCNLTVVIPKGASYVPESTSIPFNSSINESQILNYTKIPLKKRAYSPSLLSFVMEEGSEQDFALIDFNELKRELTVDDWGRLSVSDLYHVSNKATQALHELSFIRVCLLQGAYDVATWDQFGSAFKQAPSPLFENATVYRVELDSPLKENESARFEVTYRLPWEKYVSREGWDRFNLSFTLLEKMDWMVKKFSVTVVLPEGAKISSPQLSPQKIYSIQKDVFQEKLSFTCWNVTSLKPIHVNLTYVHPVFWASFRPTLWIGVLVAIGCAVALAWRAPKPPVPVVRITIRPETLKSFVEAYEERTDAVSKLESLSEKARKRKISRREYKVRRRMLERRVSTLSGDLSGLRGKIQAAGAAYADLMSQLEVAETELETVERDVERAKARYRQGKLSKGAYRRLLGEYEKRKDDAETSIDGILIRLREEIR